MAAHAINNGPKPRKGITNAHAARHEQVAMANTLATLS
jgi:hypothetical protein